MTKTMRETASVIALGSVTEERDAVKAAFQEVQSSFENFCLLAGIEAFRIFWRKKLPTCAGRRHPDCFSAAANRFRKPATFCIEDCWCAV